MKKRTLYLLLTPFFLLSCPSKQEEKINQRVPIKGVYENYYSVGTAIEVRDLQEPNRALLKYHFNSLTPENAMKFKSLHPLPHQYTFERADKIVKFAQKNKMELRGHCLIWHHPAEISDWMFHKDDGTLKSREEVLALLEEHIHRVMTRYKGKIRAWDVVNEAIDETAPQGLRETPWLKTIGPDYIEKAFLFAHKADPEALLFYNDYNTFNPKKRAYIISLIQNLQKKGVPIHGVGLQLHINNSYPSVDTIARTLNDFRELGIKIDITELDMSVYSNEFENLKKPTEEQLNIQAYKYQELFQLFENNEDIIDSVTLWGYYDGKTWLRRDPYNRLDWPLPFDETLEPKLAYRGLIKETLPPRIEPTIIAKTPRVSILKGSPLVDGKRDEIWKKALPISTEITLLGENPPQGELSFLWDKKSLYFWAKIDDKTPSEKNPLPYKQDSLEIFIDENNHKSETFETDDSQFRISRSNKQSYLGSGSLKSLNSVSKKVDGGYIIEGSIDFSTIKPEEKSLIGLEIQVNDDPGSGEREGIRKWSDPSNQSWQNTSKWGELELLP